MIDIVIRPTIYTKSALIVQHTITHIESNVISVVNCMSMVEKSLYMNIAPLAYKTLIIIIPNINNIAGDISFIVTVSFLYCLHKNVFVLILIIPFKFSQTFYCSIHTIKP